MKPRYKYELELEESHNAKLVLLVDKLSVDKTEIIIRALDLLWAAAEADKVKLIKNGQEQKVLIK